MTYTESDAIDLDNAVVCRFVPASWDDDFSYWRHLADLWKSPTYTIINVEHDMEWSWALALDLLACPHPLCTHAYQMHIPRTHWAHSTHDDGMDGYWIGHGDEWAAWSGIGFCKIAPEARMDGSSKAHWRAVEYVVNKGVRRPWHVHWPGVEHFHYADGQRLTAK